MLTCLKRNLQKLSEECFNLEFFEVRSFKPPSSAMRLMPTDFCVVQALFPPFPPYQNKLQIAREASDIRLKPALLKACRAELQDATMCKDASTGLMQLRCLQVALNMADRSLALSLPLPLSLSLSLSIYIYISHTQSSVPGSSGSPIEREDESTVQNAACKGHDHPVKKVLFN